MTRAAFVYPNPRLALLPAIERGAAPDSALLGGNHLEPHGVEAWVHDPRFGRERSSWLRWQIREAVVPWEVRDADVIVTPLFRLVSSAARLARGPGILVVNFGLNVLLRNTHGLRQRLVRLSLRPAAGIACLSEIQRRELVELSGLPEGRVSTVRLGIDERFFAPMECDEDGSILTVGKDLARDYGTFVAAVASVDARARIAALPRNVAGVDLPPNVTTSVLEPRALRDAYARASCVVISQYRDDHPVGTEHGGTTALLEAMAMGKAVVLTDRAVLHEYATDGETALVVPAEDPAALREAVERVLADADLRRRLGAAARRRVDERFTTRHMAAQLAPAIRSAAT